MAAAIFSAGTMRPSFTGSHLGEPSGGAGLSIHSAAMSSIAFIALVFSFVPRAATSYSGTVTPNCLSYNCADLDLVSIDSKENEAMDAIHVGKMSQLDKMNLCTELGLKSLPFTVQPSWLLLFMPPPTDATLFVFYAAKLAGRTVHCDFQPDSVLLDPENSNFLRTSFINSWDFKKRQEDLRFRSDDFRTRVLVASATNHDSLSPRLMKDFLTKIDEAFDVKYKRTLSVNQLCQEIDAAHRKLEYVFIRSHGNSESIILEQDSLREGVDFERCFRGMEETGKIVLLSCEAGATVNGNPFLNIAQRIASATHRTVIASANCWHWNMPPQILSTNPISQDSSASDPSMFRTFYPDCLSAPSLSSNPNCICPPCADLDENKLTPNEKSAMQILGKGKPFTEAQEALRLHRGNRLPKVLYLVAKFDHAKLEKRALGPRGDFLEPIFTGFDSKYKEVQSFQDICREIKDASRTGKLANVIIQAHGNPNSMKISETNWILGSQDFASCFSDLEPSGKIILISCNVGSPQNGDFLNNLAQTIADKAKRTVIAAKSFVAVSGEKSYTKIISLDPFMVSHTSKFHCSKDMADLSIYRTFLPQYSKCPDVASNRLHDREWLAIDAINDHLKSNGLASFTPSWEKSRDYVRFCKEDPKDGSLVLSAGHDPLGLANPKLNPGFLSALADRTDLNYKLVDSYEEICGAIAAASKIKKLALVIIQGCDIWSSEEMRSEGILLWDVNDSSHCSDQGKKEELTLRSENLVSCFSGVSLFGKVLLLSDFTGATGKDNFHDSFAQLFSEAIGRTVIAPTGNVSLEKNKITSFDPFAIFASSEEDSNQNNFREFNPYLRKV